MGIAHVIVKDLTARDPSEAAAAVREHGSHGLTVLMDIEPRHLDGRRLRDLAQAGIGGFRIGSPADRDAKSWRATIEEVRRQTPGILFLAWMPGTSRAAAPRLEGAGFDGVFASTAWWDGRAPWLADEHEALRRIAPVISVVGLDGGAAGRDGPADRRRALRIAAATGAALLIPEDFARTTGGADLAADVRAALSLIERIADLGCDGEMRIAAPSRAAPAVIVRADRSDMRAAQRALVVTIDAAATATPAALVDAVAATAGAAFADPVPLDDASGAGDVRIAVAEAATPIRVARKAPSMAARRAATAPRIAIERISPSVDDGRFAAKAVLGEQVAIEADVFADGHDRIAVAMLWRAADDADWQRVRMQPLGNDRWRAHLPIRRIGRHEFTVEAWWDVPESYRHELATKRKAGNDIRLEVEEGRLMVEEAAGRLDPATAGRLADLRALLNRGDVEASADALLAETTARALAAADPRPFLVRHEPPLPIEADRPQAAFASWYEMFPRSATDDPARHGTFADVIGRLPAIRAMGFDVLYFPPIHPIGAVNRKGRNNSLKAEPGDVGSPYAIGAADGGHDAIHPALGTIDEFRRLVAAAADEGLEIALDFAIQCAPDHPWLREHPGWFRWRPDGSLRFAENPPKKYEDIVNVDFYAPQAIPDLWIALRDVVLFWAGEGVRTFRVDNPHTKPLPFWEWMISDVRARHPDVLFLSEAFTRPKLMYRLGKLGFSQSYTYFTWRNTKRELTDYLVELSAGAPKDFFRPHFFVNTPDINPYFLQTSGRAGFLIRAALAATLSGLWGVYSGFELCEAAPLPGREEYLDSEKYEIRVRDSQAPGNIVAEIAALNRIRRAHPALHDHRRLAFYNAFDDRVLLYGKSMASGEEMILVAVSLDPHAAVECAFEIPLWEWGLPDHAALDAHELMTDARTRWTGKTQRLRLDPSGLPFAIWRIAPPEGAVP